MTISRARLVVLALCWAALQTGDAFAKDKVREEFHQTYSLNADGRISLDEVNGRVHIVAWDRNEVKVDAVKHGDKQEQVDAVKIEIDSKPDQIHIRTKYPSSKTGLWGKNNSTTVDYEIMVPAQAHLDEVETVNGSMEIEGVRGKVHASTVNGHLEVKGLASDAELNSVNGAVKASFDKLDGVKSISLKTVNGRAEVTLPDNANANVTGKTLNGGISADSGLNVKHKWPVGTELDGKLGSGGTQVYAETVNGGIEVRRAAAH
jgi:DUF4097 and DUF4098 domain-containing protein YvlB